MSENLNFSAAVNEPDPTICKSTYSNTDCITYEAKTELIHDTEQPEETSVISGIDDEIISFEVENTIER